MSEKDGLNNKFSEITEEIAIDNVDKIIQEEKINQVQKYLSIIESLSYSNIDINMVLNDLINDPLFSLDKSVYDMIEDLYFSSEKLREAIAIFYVDSMVEYYDDIEDGEEDEDRRI